MKKQIIYTLLLFLFGHGSFAQENNKWNMGFGFGIFQAPFMKGEGIEDHKLELNYSGLLFFEKPLRDNNRHLINFGLNLNYYQNTFNFITVIKPPGESEIVDNIEFIARYNVCVLTTGYSFYFQKINRNIFIGTGLDLVAVLFNRKPVQYETTNSLGYFIFHDYVRSSYMAPCLKIGYSFNFFSTNMNIEYVIKRSGFFPLRKENYFIETFSPYHNPSSSCVYESNINHGVQLTILL